MDKLHDLPRLLPLADWLGMAFFFGAWVGYAVFARHRARTRPSFLGSSNRVRRQWMLQTTYREAMRAVPLGRMSQPDDIAGTVTWLLSPDARGVTGQAIDQNGGAWVG